MWGGGSTWHFPGPLEVEVQVGLCPLKLAAREAGKWKPGQPRLVMEVGGCNLRQLHERRDVCFRQFARLRAHLLIIRFDVHQDGSFACLAVLSMRESIGGVFVKDAVGFGSAPLDTETRRYLHEEMGVGSICEYSLGSVPSQSSCLQGGHAEAKLSIPARDLCWRVLLRRSEARKEPLWFTNDLVVDLWKVFNALNYRGDRR